MGQQGTDLRSPITPAPAALVSWQARLSPSLVDATFVLWALVVALGFSHRLLNGDGDAYWQLRTGDWMLGHRAVMRVHDFSHTAPGHPFPPFEWLSQIVLAGVYDLGGFPALVVLAALVIAVAAALSVRFMQRRGVDGSLAYAIGAAAVVFTSPHWIARPHLFTFLAVPVLLSLLLPARGDVRPFRLALLFAVWANVHAGFVFGLGLAGVFLLAEVVDWRMDPSPAGARAVRVRAAALAASGVACTLNPMGPSIFSRIAAHMGDSVTFAATHEFLSPDFHRANGRVLLVAVLAIFGVLAWRARRPRTVVLLATLVMTALAFQAQRHMTLFGLVVFPLMGLELDGDWRGIRRFARMRENVERDDAAAGKWLWSGAAAVLLVLLAGSGGRLGGWRALPDRLDPSVFPVDMVSAARRAALPGNLLNEFDWGGYVLFAWPGERVFIDGATSVYGARIVSDYLTAAELRPGWREVLQRRRISMVLMRPGTPLAEELRRTPGWRVWREDRTSVLLVREGAPGGISKGGSGSVGHA